MTPPTPKTTLPAPKTKTSADSGTLLGRLSVNETGRRPTGPAPQESASSFRVQNPSPWQGRVAKFVVNMLFVPAEAVKDVLERRPGALIRP